MSLQDPLYDQDQAFVQFRSRVVGRAMILARLHWPWVTVPHADKLQMVVVLQSPQVLWFPQYQLQAVALQDPVYDQYRAIAIQFLFRMVGQAMILCYQTGVVTTLCSVADHQAYQVRVPHFHVGAQMVLPFVIPHETLTLVQNVAVEAPQF